MSSLNKATIIGRLGADPENRYMPNGEQVTRVNIATGERWRDKTTGEQRESTEWHRVSFFGKLAEIASQFLRKGSLVYVEGRLRTNRYTDKDGIERFATDIIANEMRMLGCRSGTEGSADTSEFSRPPSDAPQPPASRPPHFSDMDDDIPF